MRVTGRKWNKYIINEIRDNTGYISKNKDDICNTFNNF